MSPYSSTKAPASPVLSSRLMPTTVNPSGWERWNSSSAGASLRHGSHHEAQKLTSTHSPR